MKKSLSIILSFCILLSVFTSIPLIANAVDTDIAETGATSGAIGDCTWSLNGTELTISGNGVMGAYNDEALPWDNSITKVTIEDGVTTICEDAFFGCTNLTSVTIPDSVAIIGSFAFYECTGLTSVTIPDSVTYIGNYAFFKCTGLTSVTIPDSVKSVGMDAFYDTAWYDNHPDGLVYAGKIAYQMKGICPSEVVIKNGTLGIAERAFADCFYLNSVKIPDSVKTIGNSAFYDCGNLISVTIPDSVTSIGYNTFFSCDSLTSVTIPDSVTAIGDGAFYACYSLTSLTIGNSVMSIGEDAFSGCSCLTSLTIPDSVIVIGENAFDGTAWYNNQPNGLVYAGKVAYKMKGDSPSEVVIKSGTSGIAASAFERCESLTSVKIPDSVIAIGERAFNDTAWYDNQPDGLVYAGKVAYDIKGNAPSEIVIKDGTLGIASLAFYNCLSLTSMRIPDSVKTIGDEAFAYCYSLTSVTIPDSVILIGREAFCNCRDLTSVTIPDSVTVIGDHAFGYYDDLFVTKTVNGFTVMGYPGTATQKYADDNGFTFIAVTDPSAVIILGDADGDGELTIMDATRVQRWLAELCDMNGSGYTGKALTANEKKAADADEDGDVTIIDATAIQRHVADLPTNKNIGKPIA